MERVIFALVNFQGWTIRRHPVLLLLKFLAFGRYRNGWHSRSVGLAGCQVVLRDETSVLELLVLLLLLGFPRFWWENSW